MRVRMELFAKIRRDARVEGLSIRGLAKKRPPHPVRWKGIRLRVLLATGSHAWRVVT